MKHKHTYEFFGSGVDYTGFFKIWLRRDDGKEIKVSRKRCADLNREGRVRWSERPEEPFGDCRYFPTISNNA